MQKKLELTEKELATIDRRRAVARARARRLIETSDPEEDARIEAAARADPDALPMTDEELSRLRPAHEVHPELVAAYVRRKAGRPKAASIKQLISLRLDPEVIAYYRSLGAGWQTQINELLKKEVSRASRRSR